MSQKSPELRVFVAQSAHCLIPPSLRIQGEADSIRARTSPPGHGERFRLAAARTSIRTETRRRPCGRGLEDGPSAKHEMDALGLTQASAASEGLNPANRVLIGANSRDQPGPSGC